jgi:hypothetical protein
MDEDGCWLRPEPWQALNQADIQFIPAVTCRDYADGRISSQGWLSREGVVSHRKGLLQLPKYKQKYAK